MHNSYVQRLSLLRTLEIIDMKDLNMVLASSFKRYLDKCHASGQKRACRRGMHQDFIIHTPQWKPSSIEERRLYIYAFYSIQFRGYVQTRLLNLSVKVKKKRGQNSQSEENNELNVKAVSLIRNNG
jgi:hypothetical protein